jgi:hypothetical protein
MTQMVRTVGIVSGVAVANAAFEFLRDREADSLGVTDLQDSAVFVPAFATVVAGAAVVSLFAAVAAVARARSGLAG